MRYIPFALCFVFVTVSGCASKKEAPPPPAVSTPLEFDPTHDYELPSWWTNGEYLLHLDADGGYALYEGVNRYQRPTQRGHWWQQSYAALWLEPYAERAPGRLRSSIRNVDDAYVLNVPDLDPMIGIEAPPPVLEDRLFGGWSGSFGTLLLNRNLRYVFSPGGARPDQPAAVAGHDGVWRVEDDAVILQPDSRGMPAVLVHVRIDDDTIVLETAEGPLARQTPFVEGG
jgi:hypothetical protein